MSTTVAVEDPIQKSLDTIVASTGEIAKKQTKLETDNAEFSKKIKLIETENEALRKDLDDLRRAPRVTTVRSLPLPGQVSQECAKYIGTVFLMAGVGAGKKLLPKAAEWAQKQAETFVNQFADDPMVDYFGDYGAQAKAFRTGAPVAKAALTTSEIYFPVEYATEIWSLVETYGSFRRYASVVPMGAGTLKLPKLNASPAFGFIDMSAAVGEKAPSISNVDLDPKKAGGIVRYPTEIDLNAVIPLGQFLADYIAREMAKWMDVVGWQADGSGTYKTLTGVRYNINAASKLVTLATGNTGTDDVTLANLRTLRGIPNTAVYETGNTAYYMHPTMEALLSSFNSGGTNPWNPERETLDGWPVRWVNMLSQYSTSAVVSTVVVAFGDMKYHVLGERGPLRIDFSEHAFYTTDELAVRALQEFTVKEIDSTALAGIKTAAS